jgi:hypothetical protein
MPEDNKKPEPAPTDDNSDEVKPDPRLVAYVQEGATEAIQKRRAKEPDSGEPEQESTTTH